MSGKFIITSKPPCPFWHGEHDKCIDCKAPDGPIMITDFHSNAMKGDQIKSFCFGDYVECKYYKIIAKSFVKK